jgi:hypothetical protein
MTTTDMHFDFKNVDAVAPAMGNHLVDSLMRQAGRFARCRMINRKRKGNAA